ncbi:hypothetical protein KR054_003671, partial [Drosophila jambulina]
DAALVIAGLVPLRELVREKAEMCEELRGLQGPTGVSKAERKSAARRRSYGGWQAKWDASLKGRWTHRLIPKVEAWMERKHGQVDFYLTQVLSGHGCFRSYLRRFGHDEEGGCPECGSGIVEDARYVTFECRRFDEKRAALEEVTGADISVGTLVPLMLESPRNWDAAAEFSAKLMESLRSLKRGRKEQTG